MATTPSKALLDHVFVCLLAGGTGTRLWPRSRKATPKQFTDIFEQHTLFQQTIRRISSLIPLQNIFIITNQDYVDDVLRQEPLLPEENVIGEPQKRNTTIAIGVASLMALKKDPQAVVINLASDHRIDDIEIYKKTLTAAAKTASQLQKIVTIGIKPRYPHTGLGHIHRGQKLSEIDGLPVYQVLGFKEKPDLETAKQFTQSGEYYWNSNKFVFPAKLMLEEIATYAPLVGSSLDTISKALGTKDQQPALKKAYEASPDIAIDYSVAENSKNMVLIPGDFPWSDVGDWKVIYELSNKDKDGNVIIRHGKSGQHIGIDTKNSLIQFDNQLIATIGVENLIIVDTKDALLICHKDKAEEVKQLVKTLEEKKLEEYL